MKRATPPNMPRIEKVIKFWPYRHFFDFDKRKEAGIEGPLVTMYRDVYGHDSENKDVIETLRRQMATALNPEWPDRCIDNHSGFEVKLKNGTRAFILYSDLRVTMFQLPPARTCCHAACPPDRCDETAADDIGATYFDR